MLSFYYLLVLPLAAAGTVSITEFAVPSSVKAGESAELQCQYSLEKAETDLVVKWWWTPLKSEDKKLIYLRIENRAAQVSRPDIKIKGNDTIELEALQPSHSGTYECEVSENIDEVRRRQDLIVYTPGTGPELNLTVVINESSGAEDFLVSCHADGVAPEPELVILLDGSVRAYAASGVVTRRNVSTYTGKSYKLVLRQVVNVALDEMEVSNDTAAGEWSVAANATLDSIVSGSELRCELFYKNANVSHEAYIDTVIFDGSGGSETTPAHLEETTETDDVTTTVPGGSSTFMHTTWLAVLAAALAHFLLAH